jgi:hypothetical protein
MEKLHYIEDKDQLVVETVYDPSALIEQNKREKAANGKVRFDNARLVKVASLHPDHVTALHNMGYNIYSSDKDECRRAFCYIQENEPDWMVVEGKPFAMFRPKWR